MAQEPAAGTFGSVLPETARGSGTAVLPKTHPKPREASTLIFKIRSCTVRSDLKSKHEISRKGLIFKIRSYSARSDLKNKSARFSGKNIWALFRPTFQPWSSFPCFLGFPCFLAFRGNPCFFECFPSFPRILGVRKRRKILVFLAVFLAFFFSKKKQGKDQGGESRNRPADFFLQKSFMAHFRVWLEQETFSGLPGLTPKDNLLLLLSI